MAEERTVEENLCQLVKEKCKITWDDTDTNNRVKNIAMNAVEAMYHKLGIGDAVPPDVFLEPGLTKTLYENYCMYDWNNMVEAFDDNYKKDILTQRHRYEVENAKEKQQLQ